MQRSIVPRCFSFHVHFFRLPLFRYLTLQTNFYFRSGQCCHLPRLKPSVTVYLRLNGALCFSCTRSVFTLYDLIYNAGFSFGREPKFSKCNILAVHDPISLEKLYHIQSFLFTRIPSSCVFSANFELCAAWFVCA